MYSIVIYECTLSNIGRSTILAVPEKQVPNNMSVEITICSYNEPIRICCIIIYHLNNC